MEHNLTNELIRSKFNNQFDLVNYAIKLAENMIKSGREPRVRTDTQNRAMIAIAEIESGNDRLEDIPTEEEMENEGRYSTAKERRFKEPDLERIEA